MCGSLTTLYRDGHNWCVPTTQGRKEQSEPLLKRNNKQQPAWHHASLSHHGERIPLEATHTATSHSDLNTKMMSQLSIHAV